MSNLKKRLSEPSHVYYDINIYNKISTSSEATKLEFSEARNTPFISKANDYYLSIVRFQTDTSSIPSYEVIPQTGQVNNLIYSITIEKITRSTGALVLQSQQFLIWSPENKSAKPSDDEYYYGNSLVYFTTLINNAINAAMIAIDGSNNDYIFINYNTDDSKLEVYGLYDRTAENGTNLHATKYNLYFNRELQSLFNTLSFDRFLTATNGKYYRVRFDYLNINIKTHKNADYIINKQEFNTSSNISPVSSIVFTSSTLPCVFNQLSNPSVFENGIKSNNTSNSNFFPIITDIQVNEQFYKSNVLYVPNAQYRYIDLISNASINNIDIQCYWRDKSGNFHPLYLYSGMSASLKLLFEKKETEWIEKTD